MKHVIVLDDDDDDDDHDLFMFPLFGLYLFWIMMIFVKTCDLQDSQDIAYRYGMAHGYGLFSWIYISYSV